MTGWVSTAALADRDPQWKLILKQSLAQERWSEYLQTIVDKILDDQSLTTEDGLLLFSEPNLFELGRLANLHKQAMYGPKAYFNSNVHVNQTNICVLACRFCAFRRGRKADDAYALSVDNYLEELSRFSPYVNEVHSVGGLHPDWTVEHYAELFRRIRAEHPHISIKALTAVEIKHLAQLSNLSIKETLLQLQSAGLTSLPGGGAEILDDGVRAIICNGKESSQEYLDIHRAAHEIGLPSNCTMLFGTIETTTQRIEHILRLRDLASDTGGFQCFVPYPFLPDSTRLPMAQLSTGQEILRVIAVSRILLDSIPHIKAYRMNIGDELAELALQFGADDIDGTVQQESIMHLAGSTAPLTHDMKQLSKLINDAGCIPIKRDTTYTEFEEYVPPKPAKRLPMA
ncbi:MAG TPA: CofH family radical SAM protein [Candidatus Poseidoniaceae archaeon]|nr:MAG TPA: CofH family radical SAM protein [Candidatus Poseidoniales archaeon]DAC68748.1 MAG TPA: CofH family radical SAM protein [Candidatus Poseidoniales archaeon]HII31483.1 CofH family radical SAM protein [Candidatus Poseidoniaceae archaeon]|tara:strand:- start:715 stop:1914 length:1200 start_codon:yes stop_codon:yes gene_type:complete